MNGFQNQLLRILKSIFLSLPYRILQLRTAESDSTSKTVYIASSKRLETRSVVRTWQKQFAKSMCINPCVCVELKINPLIRLKNKLFRN